LYFDTKSCMAATSERAATPTKVTLGLAAATWLTLGASALQNGHHGVRNHSTAGLPTRLAPLNGARQRRPGELQSVVRDGRGRTEKPERQRGGHRAEYERSGQS